MTEQLALANRAGGRRRAAGAQRRHRPGRPPADRRPSTPACRPTPRAASAPPTSSSRTAPASTSARPRTAPAPAARPKPTAAPAARCRSAPRSKSKAPANRATLVYNSWLAMQAAGETDPDACAYNDFALVRLDPADVGRVNPSVPGFGGPTGVGTVGGLGSTVYSYGNSDLRGGVTKLSPKQGIVIQNEGNGWSHNVATLHPRHPRRLGQRLPQRLRRGDRRAQHPAAGAAAGLQRRRRPRQGARLPALAQRASRACSWCRAPSRSKPNLVGAILGS